LQDIGSFTELFMKTKVFGETEFFEEACFL